MKFIRNIHPAWVAFIIAAAVTLWVLSGMIRAESRAKPAEAMADNDAPANAEQTHERVKVEVTESQARKMTREVKVNARTAPVRSVHVRAETSGRVAEVVTRRGAAISKGAVIARLALNERTAQKRQAEAVLEQRRLQYEAAQRLHKDDYMTEVDLAQARANMEIAQADVDRINQDISHTVIRAPFAGVLETRTVEVGDYVSVGDEIGYIIEQDPFVVRGSVSEDVIGYLQVGQPGSVTLIDNEIRDGVIRYIAGEADEQTRTYTVELLVANPGGRLIAGASAQMRLPLETVSAHELEPATLTLNREGKFGIKIVDAENRVHFHEADIVRNQDEKVWLSGLPDTIRVITIGQDFVSAGDYVEVVEKKATQAAGVLR